MSNYPAQPTDAESLASRFLKAVEISFRAVSTDEPPEVYEHLRELNLTHLRLMGIISYQPGLNQKELAQQMRMTPAAISTALKHLEGRGSIERRPDTQDARIMRIYLSVSADELMKQMRNSRQRSVMDLLSVLTLDEQQHMVTLLEKAVQHWRDSRQNC
jgi:DNA-binding MarR family transcriptional regulator